MRQGQCAGPNQYGRLAGELFLRKKTRLYSFKLYYYLQTKGLNFKFFIKLIFFINKNSIFIIKKVAEFINKKKLKNRAVN
jgi:hypothetical protein